MLQSESVTAAGDSATGVSTAIATGPLTIEPASPAPKASTAQLADPWPPTADSSSLTTLAMSIQASGPRYEGMVSASELHLTIMNQLSYKASVVDCSS
jgi:hypothetical protein